MNLHEYQAKALFRQYKLPVPFGEIVTRWWLGIFYRTGTRLEAAVEQLETASEIAATVQSPHLTAIEQELSQTRTLLTNQNE